MRDQALARQDPALAALADQMFETGYATDPDYMPNVLQRLELHRDHGGLLAAPLADVELVALAAQARDIWPRSLEGQLQLVRTKHHVGDLAGAAVLLHDTARAFPKARQVAQLGEELGMSTSQDAGQ